MRTFYFFLLIIICTNIDAQDSLITSWVLYKDGPQQLSDFSWTLDLDEEENIYWATTEAIDNIDIKDIFAYKLNAAGEQLWEEPVQYGGQYEQQAYISAYRNGVYYIAGRNFHNYDLPPAVNGSDALLIAIDTATQDTLWTFVWDGGYSYEEIDGLVIEDDGIFITGWTEDSITSMDVLIMKIDLQGNYLWHNTWGSENYDQQDGHCVVDDSTIYVCGTYNSSLGLLFGDAHLTAFNKSDGSYKWHKLWGGLGHEDALGMNGNGDYLYQCGITNGYGDSLFFLNKWDKMGNLIWSKLSDIATKGRALDFDDEGNIYVAASSNRLSDGTDDIVVLKYDDNGNLLEYKTWIKDRDNNVQDIKIKGDYLYLVGRTKNFSQNFFFDALLIKAPLFGKVSALNSLNKGAYIKIYPNPVKNFLNVHVDKNQTIQAYEIRNFLGQQILVSNQELPVNRPFLLNNLNTGFYAIRFKINNIWYSKPFMKME